MKEILAVILFLKQSIQNCTQQNLHVIREKCMTLFIFFFCTCRVQAFCLFRLQSVSFRVQCLVPTGLLPQSHIWNAITLFIQLKVINLHIYYTLIHVKSVPSLSSIYIDTTQGTGKRLFTNDKAGNYKVMVFKWHICSTYCSENTQLVFTNSNCCLTNVFYEHKPNLLTYTFLTLLFCYGFTNQQIESLPNSCFLLFSGLSFSIGFHVLIIYKPQGWFVKFMA